MHATTTIAISFAPATLPDFLAAIDALRERGLSFAPAIVPPPQPALGGNPPASNRGPNVTAYMAGTGAQRWKRRASEIERGLDDEQAALERMGVDGWATIAQTASPDDAPMVDTPPDAGAHIEGAEIF